MPNVMRLAFLGLVAVGLSGGAVAQQPIRNGDTLIGTLRLVRTEHPNGSRILAYQIVSPHRKMHADDDFCETDLAATTFHLFASDDAARRQLKPLLGKTISVQAVRLFCAQTAWHIGDVAVPRCQ